MIKKKGNSYVVKDSTGKKTLGTHSTKQKALSQLRAIEISKKSKFDAIKNLWKKK